MIIFTLLIINLYLILLAAKASRLPYQYDDIRLGIIIVLVFIVFTKIWKPILIKGMVRAFLIALLIYGFIIVVAMVLFTNDSMELRDVFNYLFMPLTFSASLLVFNKAKKEKDLEKILGIQYITLFVFFIIYVYSRIGLSFFHGALLNTAYYQIAFLPFVFIQKNRNTKNIGILLILVTTILSMKRTAIFAIIAGILITFYYKSEDGVRKKSIISLITKGSIFFLVIIFLNKIIDSRFGFNLVSRIMMLTDDGGSGRAFLLETFLNNINNNSVLQHIFGNGLNYSSAQILGMHSVHNDFLEVYYRLGAIGLFVYFNFYRLLFKVAKILKTTFSDLYPAFLSSIVMFTIISFTSMLFFVPSYLIIFCIFWSYCLATVKFR